MVLHVIDFSKGSPRNPLNPLGEELRIYIAKQIEIARNDPNITSVVLLGGTSKKASFSAGADLSEFSKLAIDKGSNDDIPTNIDLVNWLENFPKPTIAVMSGVALGGGLELALACHYRLAYPGTKMGLPEVNVGVIPGAGGTQRLPRLVGVQKALEMILKAKLVAASPEVVSMGLLDAVVSNPEDIRKWAEWAEVMPLEGRRVGRWKLEETGPMVDSLCAAAAKQLPPRKRGGHGVHAAVKAVQDSQYPIAEGQKRETELFLEVLQGSQGQARGHVFFAQRKAQKPIVSSDTTLGADHPVLHKSRTYPVAVFGAGFMGSGIALVLLQFGFTVYLVDITSENLCKGVAFIKKTLASHCQRGKISEETQGRFLQALRPTTRVEDLKDCILVVEAVVENMSIKQEVFGKLDPIVKHPQAIFVSNTSTLDMDQMASVLVSWRRPNFAGWHFFTPPHVSKLVEIVRGSQTSIGTLAILQQLTRQIQKMGVLVGNCDGFVANRMVLNALAMESVLMLTEGQTIEAIDRAMVEFGMVLGPFVISDLAGNEILYYVRRGRGWVRSGPGDAVPRNRPERYTELADDLVSKLGRYGQKTGKGWYDYDPKIKNGRKPLPSKEVTAFIQGYVLDPKPAYPFEYIVERCLFPLVNEGFKILEEGMASCPSDIDVIFIYGYGWPVWRGGPMYWADHEVGLKYLLQRLQEFSRVYGGQHHVPSQLLEQCVQLDVTVEEYYKGGWNRRQVSRL